MSVRKGGVRDKERHNNIYIAREREDRKIERRGRRERREREREEGEREKREINKEMKIAQE
jgi:hypothetical protein